MANRRRAGFWLGRAVVVSGLTLYVLLSEKPFSIKDTVAGFVGVKAVAKGKLVERAGVKALQLASIERRPAS